MPVALPDCWACNVTNKHASPAHVSSINVANRERARAIWLFSLYRDGRYLDARVVHQPGHLHRGAGGLRVGHDGFVSLVHFGEVMNVSQEHRYGDDILQFETGGPDCVFDAGEGSLAFRADAAGHKFALVVDAFLSGDVKRVT